MTPTSLLLVKPPRFSCSSAETQHHCSPWLNHDYLDIHQPSASSTIINLYEHSPRVNHYWPITCYINQHTTRSACHLWVLHPDRSRNAALSLGLPSPGRLRLRTHRRQVPVGQNLATCRGIPGDLQPRMCYMSVLVSDGYMANNGT